MRTVLKPYLSALAVVAVVAMASACGSDEEGTALPQNGAQETSASSTAPPSTDSSAGASAGLDPCTLLSDDEAAQFGDFDPHKADDSIGTSGCAWDAPHGSEDSTSFEVVYQDKASIDQVNDTGGGVDKAEMNGRSVARAPVSNGSACTVALALDSKSRVDVNVVLAKDVQSACELAEKVATVVEPKLPEG